MKSGLFFILSVMALQAMCEGEGDSSAAALNADVDQSNADESPAAQRAPAYPASYGRPSRYYQPPAYGEHKALKGYNILVPSNIVINLDGSVEAGNDNGQGVKSEDSEASSQNSVNQADIDQNYQQRPQDVDYYSSDVNSWNSYESDGYYQPQYRNGYDGYYQPQYRNGYDGYYQPRSRNGYYGPN